jgi:prepilin-type N-terminal cleavage/methylation domain-containing protein
MKYAIRPKNGFTLIEMMIVVGIVALVTLGVFSMVAIGNTQMKTMGDFTNASIGQTVAERALSTYIAEATLSYNSLIQLDDNGNNFWDKAEEIPAGWLPLAKQTRIYTMFVGGKTKFRMLVNYWQHAEETSTYDPAAAYSSTLASGNGSVAGTLTYMGINNNNYAAVLNPNLWIKGALVAMYSPVILREPDAFGNFTLTDIPRAEQIIGQVVGNDLVYNNWGGTLEARHPQDATIIVNDFDKFLRQLPMTGGAAPTVLMRRVNMVEFELANNATGRLCLTMKVWNGATFNAPDVLAVDVDHIILQRPDVTMPLVSFEVIMSKKKVLGQ